MNLVNQSNLFNSTEHYHILQEMNEKVSIYVSYSAKDEQYLDLLNKHLKVLSTQDICTVWDRTLSKAGDQIEPVIESRIKSSDIVLVLLSVDYLVDPISTFERKIAASEVVLNKTEVWMVYLRSVDRESIEIKGFRFLPGNDKPLNTSPGAKFDESFALVAQQIKFTIASIYNAKKREEIIEDSGVMELIKQKLIETDEEKLLILERKLRSQKIKQLIVSEKPGEISFFPVSAIRKFNQHEKWAFTKHIECGKIKENYDSEETERLKHIHMPLLVHIDSEDFTPNTLYINRFCEFIPLVSDGDNVKEGDSLGYVMAPLFLLIDHLFRKEPLWLFAKGMSNFEGILTYQPDLSFWIQKLVLRYSGRDDEYGRLSLRPSHQGRLQFPAKIKPGITVKKDEVVAITDYHGSEHYVTSPIDGVVNSILIARSNYVYEEKPVITIKSFPLIVKLEIDFLHKSGDTFQIISPVKGIFHSTLPGKAGSVLNAGRFVKDSSIICYIQTPNIIFGLFVAKSRGKIKKVYPQEGSRVNIKDVLFEVAPDFVVIRAHKLGIFYGSKEPGIDPFVRINGKVEAGQIVGIIESQKMRDYIISDYTGVVENILIEDSCQIGYGEPVITLRV